MQIEFNEKTNEVSLKFSINPKTSQLSSTKKTFIAGQDGGKLDAGGKSIRISVIATIPNDGATKKGKR